MEDGSRPAARVAAEQDRQAVRAVRAGLGGRGDREPAHAGHSGGPGACQRGCVRGRGPDCRCGSQLCAEPVGMAPDRQAAHAEGDAAVLGRVRRRLAGLGLTSHYASVWAKSMGLSHWQQTLVVELAYLLANCVTFVTRFVIFHYLLFADRGSMPQLAEPVEAADSAAFTAAAEADAAVPASGARAASMAAADRPAADAAVGDTAAGDMAAGDMASDDRRAEPRRRR